MVVSGKPARGTPVTRGEVDKLARDVADMRLELSEARKSSSDTHSMVQAIHQALMKPSPGQDDSLLDRMAAVTISIESGGKASGMVVRLAALLAAIGSIWAAIKHGWV